MIDNTFTLQEIIGLGGSSKVFSSLDYNNNKYAIKIIRNDKSYDSEYQKMIVLREYLVMDHIGEHPNIIKHFSCNPEGTVQHNGMTQDVSYNVMEYCENGCLSSIIKSTGTLEEDISRFIFTQLCSAVKFLHDKMFAHLDIKLENMLLDEYFNVKLADFGSGVSLHKTKGMTDHKVGTPLYMPPEIRNLGKNQIFDGKKADIYSLGVTLSLMLLGQSIESFEINDGLTISSTEASVNDNMDVDLEDPSKSNTTWKFISTEARELLMQMLHSDPTQRPSIDQILESKWMTMEKVDGLQESVFLEMKARMISTQKPRDF